MITMPKADMKAMNIKITKCFEYDSYIKIIYVVLNSTAVPSLYNISKEYICWRCI